MAAGNGGRHGDGMDIVQSTVGRRRLPRVNAGVRAQRPPRRRGRRVAGRRGLGGGDGRADRDRRVQRAGTALALASGVVIAGFAYLELRR